MKKKPQTNTMIRGALMLLISSFAICANAQTGTKQASRTGFALGAEIGTTGIGPVLNYTVSPELALSLSYGVISLDYDNMKSNRSRYDADIDLSHLAAVVDWYPTGGRFHLSAGAVLYDHKMDVTARPRHGEKFEIGDHSYNKTQLESLTGKLNTGSKVAPYIGFGWTWHLGSSGIDLITNFGAMFTQKHNAKLTASGPITSDATFIADLRKEEDELNDGTNIYPVAKAGIVYRF